MNRQDTAEDRLQETPPAADPGSARGWMKRLRAQIETGGGDPEVERVLSGLFNAVERTLVEHKGMASELLSVYEQLGVLFEVTHKLADVREEEEVVALFAESLRRSFSRCEVFVVRPAPDGGWSAAGTAGGLWVRDLSHVPKRPAPACGTGFPACLLTDWKIGPTPTGADRTGPTEWLGALMSRARCEARVVVERPREGHAPEGVLEVMVGPVVARPAGCEPGVAGSGDSFVCAIVLTRGGSTPEFVASDMLLLEALTMFCGDSIRNHRLVRELRETSFALVRSLVSAVDQKDEYTSGHSLRVGYFSTLLGRQLGLGEQELQMLQWSALLHDVGKIGIRDDVLKKQGKLTPEEFDHIKEHPVRSHKVVQEIGQLAGALDGVLHHHEHYDGTGYPAGLDGDAIPLQARIIQVADVFDALTSTRSYRRAYDWERALAILEQEAGRTVDPHVQGVFDGLIRAVLEPGASALAGSAQALSRGSFDAWKRLVRTAERCPQVAKSEPVTSERRGE